MRFAVIVSTAVAVWGISAGIARAAYTETMTPDMPQKNLAVDYGLIDDGAARDQSDVFQRAIDELAATGGGRLIVPKGTYRLAGVRLKSNVHLLFEAGTVIKPNWPPGTKTVVFILDAERPPKRQATEADEKAFIENVSLRGLGGRWIVDYSDRKPKKGEGVRAVVATMVRNFLIADLLIKDNYTTYCGITLSPLQTERDTSNWPVSRATDGTVRNCRIVNASPGYGLTQLHGAQSIFFKNIYAKGGVTLRLETGAVGPHTGVYDIKAKNVVNKNGRCAVMLGPHSAVNGVVQVDGVRTESSAYAVTIGLGGVKEAQQKIDPDATNGSFAEGSYVKNIHAVFGMRAQIKTHSILEIPEEYYDDLQIKWFDKFFEGPSIGAVRDNTEGRYHVIIENVTMEGFKYNADKPILTPADVRPGKWPEELRKWKASHPDAAVSTW